MQKAELNLSFLTSFFCCCFQVVDSIEMGRLAEAVVATKNIGLALTATQLDEKVPLKIHGPPTHRMDESYVLLESGMP